MIDLLAKSTGLDRQDIVDLLPFILMEIRNYTHQYFLTLKHLKVTKITSNSISVETEKDMPFEVGDSVELLNSENNTQIYQIKSITGSNIVLEQPIVSEKDTENIVMIKLSFKGVSTKTISGMLIYSNNFAKVNGIKSQTLGGYNVTFATPDNGETAFPLELYGGLNSLKKLDDDFAEYERKNYVRL